MIAKNPIKAIEGSLRKIVDPIENVIRNTYLFTAMAEKNAVGTALVDMLIRATEAPEGHAGTDLVPVGAERLPDVARGPVDQALSTFLAKQGVQAPEDLVDAMRSQAEGEPSYDTVTIFRNGKKEVYDVGADIARAMKGLDSDTTHFLLRMIGVPTNTLRAGAVLTFDFAARHMLRDYVYANITGPQILKPADMLSAAAGLITKDADYRDWLKGGGANVSSVSLDRRYLQEKLDSLTAQTGLMTRAWNVVGNPDATLLQKAGAVAKIPFNMVGKYAIHPLQVAVEFAEGLSHFAAFKKMRRGEAPPDTPALAYDNGRLALDASHGTDLTAAGSDVATTGFPNADSTQSRSSTPQTPQAIDAANKRAIQEAAWVSRDTAVDAARMGAKMHAFNSIVAFANITLQDTDRVARALKDNPARTSMALALGVVLPSALLWWATKDEKDSHGNNLRDQIPDWEKDTFWILPTGGDGPIFRIPKPFGTGVLFGSGTERVLDAVEREKPDALKGFVKSLFDTVVPSFLPTVTQPIIEQFANRSLFTNRTLIPQSMEKGLPEYQQTPYTSQTARSIGRVLGAFPGISDAKMDPSSPAQGVARALSSPILLENYLRAWTGNLGTYVLAAADAGLRKTGVLPDPPMPASTLADIPFIRAFMVRYPTSSPQGIQDFEDMYDRDKAYFDTWKQQIQNGDPAAAQSIAVAGGPRIFAQLDSVRQVLTEQNQIIRDIYKNPSMPPDEKRQLIDQAYYAMTQVGQQGADMMRRLNSVRPRGR